MSLDYKTLGAYPGRFAGVEVNHPKEGDTVEILEGDFVGKQFTVTSVEGWVYSIGYRIYVDTKDDIPTWYWPWNLKIVKT